MTATLLATVLLTTPAQAPTKGAPSGHRTSPLTMVYVSRPNCPACDRMHSTFEDPTVARMIRPMHPQFLDSSTASGRPVAQKHRISAYPTTLFIDGSGRVAGRVVGYRTPGQFTAEISAAQRSRR